MSSTRSTGWKTACRASATCHGGTITEADWRLFTTLVRFDPVYVGHFKCNIRRIADYPNLSNYTARSLPGSRRRRTVDLDHIKRHYYASHDTINPTRIVPGRAADRLCRAASTATVIVRRRRLADRVMRRITRIGRDVGGGTCLPPKTAGVNGWRGEARLALQIYRHS
jgi:hypothetical protein